MTESWRRGLIILAAATVLSVGTVAPASAATVTSTPTVLVSCNAATPAVCTETIITTIARVTYTVVITFVDNDKSRTLTRGDLIQSITVSRS